jgi:DSF synthase
MGVVDILAEDGQGEKALSDWIRKNHRSLNSFQAIQRAKQRVNPLTVEELYDITEIWVDAALRLRERDLKIMERLVRAQNRKVESEPQTDTRVCVERRTNNRMR